MLSCSNRPVSEWSDKELSEWYSSNAILKDIPARLSEHTDKRLFAEQYLKNKKQWDVAFIFLSRNDLSILSEGRYDITERTFANVQSYLTKDSSVFEAHRKYIDIQYIVSGVENIEVSPIDSVYDKTADYNETKDIEFYASSHSVVNARVDSGTYIILFPSDAHKPCMTLKEKSKVKKIVVKIPYAE